MSQVKRVKNKKKKGARKGKGIEAAASIPRIQKALYGQFVPDITHVRLRYGIAPSGPTAATFGASSLHANDVRDPGGSLAATSADGFAGLIANYYNWYVLGSTIVLKASHGADAAGIGAGAWSTTVGVFPSFGTALANDRSSAEAQPGCKFVTFDIGGQKTIRQRVACAECAGQTHAQYISDTGNWGSSVQSPTNTMYWNFWVQSSVAQTNVSVHYDIEIVYDVCFFRRRSLDLAFERRLLALVLEREAWELKAKETPKKPAFVRIPPSQPGEGKSETKQDDDFEEVETASTFGKLDPSTREARIKSWFALKPAGSMPATPGKKASTLK